MPKNPKIIAVVEDEAALKNVLVEWLKTEGYEAYAASTGPEAIDLIPQRLPDLVLLDIILPEKSGFEVMKELKKNPLTAEIPVVILTNLGDDRERKTALSLGAKNYLIKADNDFAAMKKVIESTLKSSRHNNNHKQKNGI